MNIKDCPDYNGIYYLPNVCPFPYYGVRPHTHNADMSCDEFDSELPDNFESHPVVLFKLMEPPTESINCFHSFSSGISKPDGAIPDEL